MGESKALGRATFVLIVLVILGVVIAFGWLVWLSAMTLGASVALVGTAIGGLIVVLIALAGILFLAALAFYPQHLSDEIVDLAKSTQDGLAASSDADFKSVSRTEVSYDD